MNIIYLVGAFDAVIIVALGLVAAGVILLGKDAEKFWHRVLPACAILIGTSIAAGIVLAITRWLIG